MGLLVEGLPCLLKPSQQNMLGLLYVMIKPYKNSREAFRVASPGGFPLLYRNPNAHFEGATCIT